MRFVARVFSLIFLVFAVIAGLVDAIQSVAAGQPVLTPMIESWSANSPDTLALVAAFGSDHQSGTHDIDFDAAGRAYVADTHNNRVTNT